MKEKTPLDSVQMYCNMYKGNNEWYTQYRKFWEQIEQDKKKVKR